MTRKPGPCANFLLRLAGWGLTSQGYSHILVLKPISLSKFGNHFSPFTYIFSFKAEFQIVLAGLELHVPLRMAWNFCSFCFHLPSAGITGVSYHVHFILCWGPNPGHYVQQVSVLPTELHLQPHSLILKCCMAGDCLAVAVIIGTHISAENIFREFTTIWAI